MFKHYCEMFRTMTEDELQEVASALSYSLIIPNWFHRHHVSALIEQEVDKGSFADFHDWIWKTGWADEMSEAIRELWANYQEDREDQEDQDIPS